MSRNAPKRLVALLTVVTTAVAGLALAPLAAAVEDVETTRLAGSDRFATAAEVAKAAYPNGTDNVIIASGRAFPDALAGAALAGTLNAPVLLTERDRLPSATSGAVRDLGAETVYILGGTAAVSQNVQNSFELAGYETDRIAGDDRYETAAEIGRRIGAASVSDLDALATAFVATGLNFADALAGGPLAGAGAGTGVHPILVVNTDVPAATEAAIAELGIEQVAILGGTSAVSSSVEAELEELTGNPAIRYAGTDRYATAIDVAEAAIEDFGFTAEEVLLANGVVFADALAGGPLGAVRQAPIVLTQATTLPSRTSDFFERETAVVAQITVLGGTAAVSDKVVESAEAAAETPAPAGQNETITVLPRSDADQANGTTREYTATGLGTTPVDIVLVECADVITSDGNTAFHNVNNNAKADRTAREGADPDVAKAENARISAVNGSTRAPNDPRNEDYADSVAPTDGSITFVVSGPSSTSSATACVLPVVFRDLNNDDALNGSTNNPTLPNEEFGTGGRTTFGTGGAPAGPFGEHEVQETGTDKTTDRVRACSVTAGVTNTADCKTFRYDANDRYQIDSQTTTMELWEAALSPGDALRGTYADDPSGVSTFNLTDAADPAPIILTVSASDPDGDNKATVGDVHTFTFSEPVSVATGSSSASYQVTGSGPAEAGQITCDSQATCQLSPDQRVLTVTLTALPQPGLVAPTYPLNIESISGITDSNGQAVDLTRSDRTIEKKT